MTYDRLSYMARLEREAFVRRIYVPSAEQEIERIKADRAAARDMAAKEDSE